MLPSLLLLSTSVLSMPVIISEVKATRESGHLRVEVRGDGGIDPETARTRIEEGSLYLFLGGTRVKADNRAWNLDLGVGEIRAHRHRTETELDVPLVGNGCSGPVELQGTSTGMIALVGCDGAAPVPSARGHRATTETKVVAPTAGEAKLPARTPEETKPAVETKPAARATAEVKEGTKAAAPSLNALVALPASDEAPVVKAASVLPVAGQPEAAPMKTKKHAAAEVEAAAKDADENEKSTDVTADAKSAVVSGLAAAKQEDFSATASPHGGLGIGKMAVPVILLAGVAIAAYLFTRRKRAASHRQIEILESASLGPKRSLIVARVGEETLYLGSSEAGITLLKSSGPATQAVPAAVGEAPRAPVNELDQSLTDALADVPEPSAPIAAAPPASFRSIEGGLASLFGRGATSVPARPEPRPEPGSAR